MKVSILCSVIVLGFSGFSRAQAPAGNASPSPAAPRPELPSGPLLRAAGAFAQWEIAFTYPDDAKGKSVAGVTIDPRSRKVVATKTEGVIHEEVTDVLGHRTDTWFKDGTQYRKSGTNPTWYEAHAGIQGDTSYTPLPATGFRNLEWITTENFAGIVTAADNRKCLVFSPGGYQKLDLSSPSRNDKMAVVDSIAYIDADTRLPISVRTHGETRVYLFRSAPSQLQTLPEDLIDQIRKGAEARARALQPAARPY